MLTEERLWNDGGDRPSPDDQRIGPYRVVRELGRGGMGTVYLCEDTAVGDRLVALKVVHDVHAGTADHVERFRREIRNLGTLRHPNLVQVLYAGEHEGHPYFVMEYVPGRDLNRWLDDIAAVPEAQRIEAIVRLMVKVARGVAHAHAKGTIHRDLKPQNILVREDGEPMVLDFGIAKHREDTTLTATAATPGTPSHMAPEQFEPLRIQHEELVDVWALGTILYFALTRERPFKGQSLASVSYQIVHANPAALRKLNPLVPAALEAVVLGCLEKDPRRRPQGAQALADRLEATLGDVLHAARRRKTRGVALLAVASVALIALALRPWKWWQAGPDVSDLEPAVESVAGVAAEGAAGDIPIASFQPAVRIRFARPAGFATLEAALEAEDGVELSRALLSPEADGTHHAALRVPADLQREGLRARVVVHANGERLDARAPTLVMDTSPPRIAAVLEKGGAGRAWESGESRIEVERGSTLRVLVTDPSTPLDGEWRLDADGAGRFDRPVSIEGDGPWSGEVAVRDAAGNLTVRRFDAMVVPPASRPAPPPESRPESGPRLPEVWGKVTRIGSQTKFDRPAALRPGENHVLVENALHEHEMSWRLRVVDPGGATVAECTLAPEAIFGAPTHRVLGGRLVLPSPPEGRVLTGEFRIEDPSGKVRTQPIASPRFLEGSHKPRVRFTTARGDVVIELERLLSPAAVEAFLDHVRDGDYSGAIFHELREDQFVKGGVLDAKLEPVKPPRRPLPPEWIETRPKPTTSKMTVALTGHAEFMIHVRDNPNLAILKSMVEIGKVVEGQDLIAAIAREPVVQSGDQPNAPVRPLAIEKAEVVEE